MRRTLSWEEAVADFLVEKRRANCSPATLETYRSNLLGPRGTWLRDHGIARPDQLTPECLREVEIDLLDRLAPATVHQYHRTLHAFLRHCSSVGLRIVEATLSLRGPALPDTAPEPFTADEERRLLHACRSQRDRLLLRTLIQTGLRLGELCALTIDDLVVAPEGAYVRIRHGKGGKDRVVPLDTPATRLSDALAAYTRRVRPPTQDRHLFLSTRRRRGDWQPLTPHGVKQVFRRLRQTTGIHAHAHRCRHTFATRALSAGIDPLTLQRALGHSSLEMVNRYVHHRAGDLLAAWARRAD